MSSSSAGRAGPADEPARRDSGARVRTTRRGAARVPVEIAARVVSAGTTSDATIVNLGIGGVFVRFAPDVAYGDRLEICFEHSGRVLRLPAVVRWTDGDGFGAQFTELGAVETAVIAGFIARDDATRTR